jgi:hypothetical protein
MAAVARGLARGRERLRREGAIHSGALALVIAGGAAMRIGDMFVEMRYDEASTFLWYVTQPWETLFTDYSLPNNHLLNTLIMHLDWMVLGDKTWVHRLPAVTAGIALIPATYAVGRILYDRDAGLWAAGLTASAGPLVEWSVNARGYMLGALFLMTATAFGAHALTSRSRVAWAAFAASCVLSFYAVPVMGIGIAIVAGWLGLEAVLGRPPRARRERLRDLRSLAVALAAAAVVSTALYAPTFGDEGWSVPYDEPLRTVDATWTLAKSTAERWHRNVPEPLGLVVAAGFVAGVALHRRLGRHTVPLAITILPVIAGVVALEQVPPFHRGWTWILTIYFVVAGAGLAAVSRFVGSRLRGRGTLLASGLAVLAALAIAVGHRSAGDDRFMLDQPAGDEDVAQFARDRFPGHSILAQDELNFALVYYFRRHGLTNVGNALEPWDRADRRVLLVCRSEDNPIETVRGAYAFEQPGSVPRLIRRWRWIALWEVRLAPPGWAPPPPGSPA